MRIQTADENVGAFIDMMSMAVGVAGERLAPWLEAYFKLRCLEVMEAEEAEEARARKIKTMPTPGELKAVQEHKKLAAGTGAQPTAPALPECPAEPAQAGEAETVEAVPAEIVEPAEPAELPKKVSFPGNGSKTKKDIYARLMKARMEGVSFERIASQRRDLTGSIVMDMASAVKVDFKLWESLSMALRELGY